MAGIIEFYKGKHIFITGATGFLGKALIEKLLRSCPDIGNIYVVIRPKKGKDPIVRLKELTDQSVYDLLRQVNPESFKKIIPLFGDCSELGLGLSPSDRQLLVENVSVVFHAAANVRFDDPLKRAILLNTRGTREVMMLARDIKNLKVFVYVSTAYSNCDRSEVQEILYPPHADWRDAITIAENIDERTLNLLTPIFMRNLPNTYTFTKSLAEHVVKDLSENIPTVILRPSIVINSYEEPFPGWIDNFNGPFGLTIAAGKGILRTIYGNPDNDQDFVPIDVCIKFLIIASWLKAISGDTSEVSVYNSSNNGANQITIEELLNLGHMLTAELPLNDIIWHPHASATSSIVVYYFKVVFLQVIPAIIIDAILKFYGKKPMLCKIQQKIYVSNMALSYFTTRSWIIHNRKTMDMRLHILPCDKKEFFLDHADKIKNIDFFRNAIIGSRIHLLKEYDDTIPKAKKHYNRMLWISRCVRLIAFGFLSWFMFNFIMWILN